MKNSEVHKLVEYLENQKDTKIDTNIVVIDNSDPLDFKFKSASYGNYTITIVMPSDTSGVTIFCISIHTIPDEDIAGIRRTSRSYYMFANVKIAAIGSDKFFNEIEECYVPLNLSIEEIGKAILHVIDAYPNINHSNVISDHDVHGRDYAEHDFEDDELPFEDRYTLTKWRNREYSGDFGQEMEDYATLNN